MPNNNSDQVITVNTSKVELEGTMSLAASYRFTLALLGSDIQKKIAEGKTSLQAEIDRLEKEPSLMEKLSSDLVNKILISDDAEFRNQIIDLLDSVFGEVPEEHFVEMDTDTPRVRNRKRNNQINTIVAIFEAMKSQRLAQEFAELDDELDDEEAGEAEEIIDIEIEADDHEQQPVIAHGISDAVAKLGAVDLNTLPPELQQQILDAIASGKQIAKR